MGLRGYPLAFRQVIWPQRSARTNSPAALDVACPICSVQPGELCQDVMRGCIGPIERPHLYRISVAADEVEQMANYDIK